MAEKKGQSKQVRVKTTVRLLESRDAKETPAIYAYAFSWGGQLLAREAVDDGGTATLSFPAPEEPQPVRILAGPEAEEKTRVSDLLRRGAEERVLRIDPGKLTPSLEIAVIPDNWRCWLLGLCFVPGTLLKRVDLGGIPVDVPVCDATLEIYEVDPLLVVLPRLADDLIERIRDVILNPPPPPVPDIGPVPPPPPPGPFPRGPEFGRMPSLAESGNTLSPPPAERTTSERTAFSGEGELRTLARTASTFQLRHALLDYPRVARLALCFIGFPVSKRLVATAKTDHCGRFRAYFFRGCNNPDTPDLYFKAKQRLALGPFSFTVTIYEPTPVSCYTHWNYRCGTEVTLYTTHALAATCKPCPPVIAPNNWVLAMAVGNLPLSRIRGTSAELEPTTTPTNLGLTDTGAPFGGLLRLRLEFDTSLRESLGVRYYRVSYRKGTSGSFAPLTGSVHRHYTHEVGGDLALEVYDLGPKVVNGEPNLFEIPPGLPPLGQWSYPDLLEDLTSAKFPTKDLAPAAQHGKYQMKVDLFDKNGNLVDVDAEQITYRVPAITDLSGDIPTDDADDLGLVVDDDGDGNRSFVFTLHLDNNACTGTIDAPTLNGTPASDECGVLEYNPGQMGSVTMTFSASHPNGFATYSFRLFRGAPPPILTDGGSVGAGSFAITRTASELLDSCTVAGFSENLHVAARATNGWHQLHEYDAHDVRAFVLAPPSAGPGGGP